MSVTWNTWKTFEDAYRDGSYADNHPAYGFLIYSQAFIDMDFNPSGVIEACVAVDGNTLEIVGSVWDGSQDCWNTVEIDVNDIEFWTRKPAGPK